MWVLVGLKNRTEQIKVIISKMGIADILPKAMSALGVGTEWVYLYECHSISKVTRPLTCVMFPISL
jgi:hypothetical protein